MRKVIIAGNWKMNKETESAVSLVRELKTEVRDITDREIVVCPPFTLLGEVKKNLCDSNIFLGGQNMFWEKEGAYTGEISPLMLKDAGCKYVIIGHSERRAYFGETNESVNKKVKTAFCYDFIPIVCIGETLAQREKGEAFGVVEKQLREGLADLKVEDFSKLVVAYEPVWAIGTGKTATPLQAEEIHKFIREILESIFEGKSEEIRILYGGSIKPENISDLMSCQNIDGGLIGGASLSADNFIKIIKFI
ncbi:triose-phosphate isomerase [bacterium]|nr:triose-phosphate isomerase [bacterium]